MTFTLNIHSGFWAAKCFKNKNGKVQVKKSSVTYKILEIPKVFLWVSKAPNVVKPLFWDIQTEFDAWQPDNFDCHLQAFENLSHRFIPSKGLQKPFLRVFRR